MSLVMTKYKERLIDISGRNRSLISKKLYKKRAFDVSKLDSIEENMAGNILNYILSRSEKRYMLLEDSHIYYNQYYSKNIDPVKQKLVKLEEESLKLENMLARLEKQEKEKVEKEKLDKLEKLIEEKKVIKSEFDKLNKEVLNIKSQLDILENKLNKKIEKMTIYQGSLKQLHREIDDIKRETGKIELFIGYPFIEGIFEDGSFVRAPLVLYPISLEKDNGQWYIQNSTEMDVQLNKVFFYGYEKRNEVKFNIENFNVTEEQINNIDTFVIDFLSENRVTVFNMDNKSIERFKDYTNENLPSYKLGELHRKNHLVLGQFPISNSIYNDYESLIEEGVENALITSLTKTNIENTTYIEHLGEKSSDTQLKEVELNTISRLDSSQENAVYKSVTKSKGTVIYGPPGTGKSETIANIIAHSLATGKKVLMVSEKKAALDVIYNRLSEIKDKLMLLHNSNDKKQFFEIVRNSIEEMDIRYIQGDDNINELSNEIDNKINDYQSIYEELYKERKFGICLREMYEKTLAVDKEKDITLLSKIRGDKVINSFNYKETVRVHNMLREQNLIDDYEKLKDTGKKYNEIEYLNSNLNLLEILDTKEKLEQIKNSYKNIIEKDYFKLEIFKDLFSAKNEANLDIDLLTNKYMIDNHNEVVQSYNRLCGDGAIEKYFELRTLSSKYNEAKYLKDNLNLVEINAVEEDVQKLKNIYYEINQKDYFDKEKISDVYIEKIDENLNIELLTNKYLELEHSKLLKSHNMLNEERAIDNYVVSKNLASEYKEIKYSEDKLDLSELNRIKEDLDKLEDLYETIKLKDYFEIEKFKEILRVKTNENIDIDDYTNKYMENNYGHLLEKHKRFNINFLINYKKIIKEEEDNNKEYMRIKSNTYNQVKGIFNDIDDLEKHIGKVLGFFKKKYHKSISKKLYDPIIAEEFIIKINDMINIYKELIEAREEIENKYARTKSYISNQIEGLSNDIDSLEMQIKEILRIFKTDHCDALFKLLFNHEEIERVIDRLINILEVYKEKIHLQEEHEKKYNKVKLSIINQIKNIENDIEDLHTKVKDIITVFKAEHHNLLIEQFFKVEESEEFITKMFTVLEHYQEYNSLKMKYNQMDDNIVDTLEFVYNQDSENKEKIINNFVEIVILKEIILNEDAQLKNIMDAINKYEYTAKQIDKLMKDKHKQIPKYILHKWDNIINSTYGINKNFEREINKKRKVLPVRTFLNRYEDEMLHLFPCWLMNPEAISNVLPLKDQLFDIIIFDEASQIFVENTIPAIYRAKRLIVAGDDKQLRPSSTFKGRNVTDEDEEEDMEEIDESAAALEEESLLDLAKYTLDSVKLNYHYRSRTDELINFSNYAFYNGNLQVAPNIIPMNDYKSPPIQWFKVAGMWENQRNDKEAAAVVKLLKKVLSIRKNKETIGLITFGGKQKDSIIDAIDRECQLDIKFKSMYEREYNRKENNEDVGLFVKNIENVQGDERDVIIFSIGYAKGVNGKVYSRFGSLSQKGGENRLNVAISRAKKKVCIVSSIEPEELKVENTLNDGPILLKKYLQYAKAVSQKKQDEVKFILNSLIDSKVSHQEVIIESPLEEEVFDELKERGYDVRTQVGVSGYRIDLAIYDKKFSRYILGIECDGAAYHSTKSARERDFFRQRYLESRGWKIHRIWSRNWWSNKNEEINKLVRIIELNQKQLENKTNVEETIVNVINDTQNNTQVKNSQPKSTQSKSIQKSKRVEPSQVNITGSHSIVDYGDKVLLEDFLTKEEFSVDIEENRYNKCIMTDIEKELLGKRVGEVVIYNKYKYKVKSVNRD